MRKDTIKKILLSTVVVLLLAAIGGGVSIYFFIFNGLPDISQIDSYKPSLTSELYTINNVKFAEFSVEKRTLVEFKDIPDHLVKALIAVEDARFYHHNGLDWQGITRAFWENVRARSYKQGASTITQQLARALFLHPKKTLLRKAQEALLALQIEKRYSKEQILELYLNQVYLGRGAYGVEAASRTYFDKPVSELELNECVLIAGLPRAPSYYNPYRRPDMVELRRQHVLKRMLDEHFVSEGEYYYALDNPPELREQEVVNNPAPYFTEFIRQYLEDKYKNENINIYRDGLQIYTTLDLDLQQTARKSVVWGIEELDKRQGWRPLRQGAYSLPNRFSKIKEDVALEEGQWVLGVVGEIQPDKIRVQVANKQGWVLLKEMAWAKIKDLEKTFVVGDKVLLRVIKVSGEDETDYQFALEQYPEVQGALVSLDPHTGYIKAMVGGYEFAVSKFNRAVQAKRQPGSAFKPIIYTAALENGFTPASIMVDAPIIYQDEAKAKEWKPANYHEKFFGPTTIRKALEHSRNVVTVKLLKKIGIKKAIKMARKLGIESPLDEDLSLSLGSSSISLMEATSAYGVFASGGGLNKPVAIRYIADYEGNLLEEAEPQGQQVLSEGISCQMTKILQGVVERGTGWRAKSLGRPLAGKTGTSNKYVDAWFIGFSPSIVTGVWTGFDEPRTMGKLETGSRAASPIWVKFMKEALKNTPIEDFTIPKDVIAVSIDAESGMLATHECEHIIKEYFLADKAPTQPCDKHQPSMQKFLQVDLAGGLDALAEDMSEDLQAKAPIENFIFD